MDIDCSYPRSTPCSAETAAMLRRARELVEVVQPSDRLAFAVLQFELGYDLELVRQKLQLDADQFATIRQRLRYAEKPPMLRRKRRGEPPVAGWR